MNGQILTKIEHLEKELKELKTLILHNGKEKGRLIKEENKKQSRRLSSMKGLWKKLRITDEELEEAKKATFDFDVEKYLGEK